MMKSKFLASVACLLCLLSGLTIQAQDNRTQLRKWADRLKTFGTKLPQEQVFVHMDNTCYFLGDTIYFKAYVRRSDTGAPSGLSGVLYADLLNQDGFLVHRQQLELKGGQTYGSFILEDSLYGGYYELRAYTRWQLNWGRKERPHTSFANRWFISNSFADEYYVDYDKLYSRTFPVFDKPEEPGLFTHDMTMRPMRRQFKDPNETPKGSLQLFPEGGNLVAGVPCRMAFEANDENGKHLEGRCEIMKSNGEKVAEATTESRGRGCVAFTPNEGERYKAIFTWDEGKTETVVPKMEKDGVAMQVKQEGEDVILTVAAVGEAATSPIGLTVMSDGVLQHDEILDVTAQQTIHLNAQQWPNGVAQITLYNGIGRVWADRMIFIRHDDFESTALSFETDGNEQIAPYAATHVGVKGGKPGAVISLAVRDAEHSEYTYDTGNILTEMLLASHIRGFVEQPEYFFEANDAKHQRDLDLLLMVQGWRRFDWHTMTAPGAFVLNHRPEATPFMTGEVRYYQTNGSEDYSKEFAANVRLQEKTEQSGKDIDVTKEGAYKEGDVKDIQKSLDENEKQFKSSDNEYIQRVNDQYKYRNTIRKEVMVHAEFTKPGAPSGVVGEMMTQHGTFSLETPRFYEGCYFFLSASDTTKWKSGQEHLWIQAARDKRDELNYPEYYVRLKRYLPRFVQPYNWYQCHLAELPNTVAKGGGEWLTDGTRLLSEVTVHGRGILYTRFNAKAPAYVIDAYEAFNETCDLGLMPPIFEGGGRFTDAVARAYIGDMNMDRHYDLERRYDTKNESSYIPEHVKKRYNRLEYLDKVYIYTDYSPRREGDSRYDQSNQPEVIIDLRLTDPEGDGKRPVFRDRRYVLPGFSACEEFYQPTYLTPPTDAKDYRRTLYWNPMLKLDANGAADVQFYNNSTPTRISISAEGLAPDGTLMTGSR